MSKRVCIIGAGCSGITAIKNLVQAGISDIVCYDQNDDIGGNWIYSPEASHSSVCETTHIISSKTLSQYLDFPMPADYPDYPSHEQLLAYFRAYARHFSLYPYIRFNTRVERVEKAGGERWQVTLSNGEQQEFDFLFIASGHHSVPRHPDLPGSFAGEYLHAHQYKTSKPFAGKRVLVIGAGNSGCDCAVEISRTADFVAISIRRPHYIVPKFFLGKPTDTFNKNMMWVPEPLAGMLRRLALRIQVGDYREYGLEQPDFPVTRDHPTVNSELLYKIRHGKVQPRRGIQAIHGKSITFTDGRTESFDTIVAATGYKIALPFFDRDFLNYEEAERVPLYLRMFHPDHPSLVFIGLVQPQGCIWPLSDAQSMLAASYVAGRWQLPATIRQLAEQDSDQIERDFLRKKRHAIEVHYHSYLDRLLREIAFPKSEAGSRKSDTGKQEAEITKFRSGDVEGSSEKTN